MLFIYHHLRKSPIFYPGEEFTEGVYKEFFGNEGTRVFIPYTYTMIRDIEF